jgi:hypothetical protein
MLDSVTPWAAAEWQRCIFLGACDASGGGEDDIEDAVSLGEKGIAGGEFPRCITSQVERHQQPVDAFCTRM